MRPLAILTSIFLCFSFCSCSASDVEQKAVLLNLKQYQNRVLQTNDTVYVVNFLTTWCGPCAAELPHFRHLMKQYKNQAVKFIFVSLDELSDMAKLNKFIHKKKLDTEVYLLDAGDPSVWIPQLELRWEGAIPATFIYQQQKKRAFNEGSFPSKEALEAFIAPFIK